MSHLNIHARPLHSEEKKPGRPWKRKRRTTWFKKNLKHKDWSSNKSTIQTRPEDEQRWLDLLDQYSDAFEDICRSFVAGYYQEEEYVASSWAGKLVYEGIVELVESVFLPLPRDLEKCDVENRLQYIWYQAIARYSQRNPSVSFENYLFRMSLFELKHWVESIKPISLPYCVDNNYFLETPGGIDIEWLLLKDSPLNTYEKIIIFSKFYQELTDKEMAKRFGCSRQKIRTKLSKTLDRIRRIYSFDDSSLS